MHVCMCLRMWACVYLLQMLDSKNLNGCFEHIYMRCRDNKTLLYRYC